MNGLTGTMRLSGREVELRAGRARGVFAGSISRLSAGEALTVTGRNGAGKTSLLRSSPDCCLPADGHCRARGRRRPSDAPEQAHYLGHLDALKPALTRPENLAFWRALLWAASASTPLRASPAVGLGHAADLPAAYPLGRPAAAAVACPAARVRRPIWLLDEPTAALDAAAQDVLADLMREHLLAAAA